MCRLFTESGLDSSVEILSALTAVQLLSRDGKVPENIPKGHTEGWGMAGYKDGRVIFEKKRKGVALNDDEYLPAAQKLSERVPDLLIAHVRKITKGTVTSRNNHPFIYGPYAFAHNGSVDETENIPLKGYFKDGVRGNTDTERIFYFLLQHLYQFDTPTTNDIRESFKAVVKHMRQNHDYTAMNLVFSDGKTLWVLRDFNPENHLVKSMDLIDYFSLFSNYGERGVFGACSEAIMVHGLTWELMPNRQCLEFDLVNKSLKTMDWSEL